MGYSYKILRKDAVELTLMTSYLGFALFIME